MRFKTLAVLVLIVTGLLVAAFIKKGFEKKNAGFKPREIETLDLTQGLTDGFVSKIIVYKGQHEQKKIILSKDRKGVWLVESKFGLKARREAVDALLSELSVLRGEVRAASKAVFDDFSISDAKGLHVVLQADNEKVLKHLIIGLDLIRPIWNLNFMRLKGSEKVVEVGKDIFSRINLYDRKASLDDNFFADFKVASFDPVTVERAEIRNANGSLALLRSKDKNNGGIVWMFEPVVSGQDIDPAKIDEYLRNVANIYAQGALDPKAGAYGFDKPRLVIKLKFDASNIPVEIIVGACLESQKACYAVSSLQTPVFLVPESIVEALSKDKSFFSKPKTQKKKK